MASSSARRVDQYLWVPVMNLIEVDRVHPEAIEAVCEFLFDRLAREPLGVRIVRSHLSSDLRGDDLFVAVVLSEDVPGLGYSICDDRGYLVDVLQPIIDARDEIKAAIRREKE